MMEHVIIDILYEYSFTDYYNKHVNFFIKYKTN